MQLINTIEINPYDYANQEYELSADITAESPEEQEQFWIKCISDKNLGRLRAVHQGSYLVDITTINNDELEEILMKKMEDVDLPDFEDQVSSILGGIVLKKDDVIYITPNCCGDIGNIKEWESIIKELSAEWRQLWIGHPWVYYRVKNGIVEFSDYTEDITNITLLCSVSEKELQTALQKMRIQQENFGDRIMSVLDKMNLQPSVRIAKLLTGNV